MYDLIVKEGWEYAGRRARRLGPDVFIGQNWTPVIFEGEDDPEFYKSSAFSKYQE